MKQLAGGGGHWAGHGIAGVKQLAKGTEQHVKQLAETKGTISEWAVRELLVWATPLLQLTRAGTSGHFSHCLCTVNVPAHSPKPG